MVWPCFRASSSGVRPSLLRASARAPDFSSSSIIAVSPKSTFAAHSSGVMPCLSTTFTLAPRAISMRAISTSLLRTLRPSIVMPLPSAKSTGTPRSSSVVATSTSPNLNAPSIGVVRDVPIAIIASSSLPPAASRRFRLRAFPA